MKKGINGWSFAADTPWSRIAEQARAAGFDVLEPTLGEQGQLTVTTDEAACRRVADEIRAAGLEIGSVACGLFWQKHFALPNPRRRIEARHLVVSCLDRAAWMGAPVILVVPAVVAHFAKPAEPVAPYAFALQQTYEALRELAPEAESRGVIIAIENVWNHFLLSPVETRELIDRIDSPWVRVYFDVGNVMRFGFPQDWIETLGRRIARVHAKDYQTAIGTVDGFCPLGDGDVDWVAVMAALRRTGYDGPLVFEGRGDLADISARLDRVIGGG